MTFNLSISANLRIPMNENTFNGQNAPSRGEIVIYQTADGRTSIDVKLENETVWLTQAQMAMLFDKDQSVIARHIKNAFSEGEIDDSNMQILHNTLSKYKPTTVYNLDVIISVGYRVHSNRGVQFRKWANSVLKDYLIKGCTNPCRGAAAIAAESSNVMI